MNQEISKYNQFDRFLGDQMTNEEKNQFQEKLVGDNDLLQEFEEYKALIGSVKELEKEQFRNQLLDRGRNIIEQEYVDTQNQETSTKVRSLWQQKYFKWAAVAASIIILLVPASTYFYTNMIFPNQLFNQYYSPYENVVAPTVRGGEGEQKTIEMQQSLQSYTATNYQQAIVDIREFIDDNPKWKNDVALYLGISYLETGNTAKAVQTFQDIIKAENQFDDQARWYLAMSYLKEDQIEDARQQLQLLANDKESSYQKKAKQVLEQF